MSHVDEGRMAAYLDSQLSKPEAEEVDRHLAGCDECRILVEEARRASDHARAILRTAMGRTTASPSFDDVVERARVRAGRRSQGRRLSRLSSLAWAASVVLAVAVGWFARDSRLLREATQARSDISPEASAGSAAPLRVDTQPASVSPPETRRIAPPPAVANRSRAAKREEPEAKATAPVAQATPAPAQMPATGEAREMAQAPAPAAETQALDAMKQEADASAGAAVKGQVREADAPTIRVSETASLLAKSPAGDGWYDATVDEAARHLGRRPLVVSGVTVTSYAVSRTATGVVRVTHTLPDGAVMALIQQRAGDESGNLGARADRRRAVAAMGAPSAAAPLRDEVQRPVEGVTVERDGFRVTAQAALGRDSLAALLRRLR